MTNPKLAGLGHTDYPLLVYWDDCKSRLERALQPSDFCWILLLQASQEEGALCLFAHNQHIYDQVNEHLLSLIQSNMEEIAGSSVRVILSMGAVDDPRALAAQSHQNGTQASGQAKQPERNAFTSHLNPKFTFESFIEGKSNQLGRAAAEQVAENPGQAYNPLFLYGGVGLGKTHLMHAMGNRILQDRPSAKILYLHSERFVADMIKALQKNAMNEFKRFYRSIDVLLIDDIQFFSGKERSQEEFFHTFNALLDNRQQMVLTCDCYPKEINGLEERLQSRFGWGLTVALEPPELETRVAILMSKSNQLGVELGDDVAFFIAKHIQSNVRELEGALKRVIANAHFMRQMITIDFAKDALKDLLALHAKQVSIDNIQKTVAHYYKIKVADLLSKRRSRSIALPRQVAMALSKELTGHSLPEIGDRFGGRDHTTVLHACRKIKALLSSDTDLQEDYKNLVRLLSA